MTDAFAYPPLSACIELLFAKEAGDFAGRVRLAAAAGFAAVEFWHWSRKPLEPIEAALAETGLGVAGILAEPALSLLDAGNHAAYLEGLRASADVARRLGAPVLLAQAGFGQPGLDRAAGRAALVDCLGRAAEVLHGSGVRLAVEPLNTRVDHAGYFLSSTAEALDIVDEVGRPEIRLAYDLYHSMVMEEEPRTVLAGRVDRVAHLHVADHPGRGEPGSGGLALRDAVGFLVASGYRGSLGFEFRPTTDTAGAVARARRALGLPAA